MSATPSASSSAAASTSLPSTYRPVGIVLAIGSGVLIGSSFVFKKRGLLASQAGHEAGKGVAYLRSPMWWTGMIMMICGELCNFGAYAFVEAILVTPLGALSVVICAILSHFFLKEKLTLFGWIGCIQCILGAVIIAMNGPQEQSVSTIKEFKKIFLAPWFLAYGGCCIAVALAIIFYFAPRYGKKSMLWYITVCSLIGGISVSCTQGLGACIVTSIRGENQFKNWFTYFLLVFVACTLLTEIYYLNVALAMFNTAMVTPTYYVLFTFCTLVTSVILYQGLKASAAQILTIVLAFFVICTGIFILQMSKIDPRRLSRVDRKTTILLQAARAEIKPHDDIEEDENEELKEQKVIEATEEPSVDAVAGRFGAITGSIVRARRRATIQGAVARRRRGMDNSTLQANSERSIGIDSVQARALHDQWREERRAQMTNGSASVGAATPGSPTSERLGQSLSIDGLPVTHSSNGAANDHAGAGDPEKSEQRFLSHEDLTSSPPTTPAAVGTPAAEEGRGELRHIGSSPSVRFTDMPPRGSARDRAMSARSSSTLGSASHHPNAHGLVPSPPPAALASESDTVRPTLHLPSLRIPHIFSRFVAGRNSEQPDRRQQRPEMERDVEKGK